MTREQKLELAPNYKNVPIGFFGRIVDQDNRPLSGVRVVASARQWLYAPVAGLTSTHPTTEALSASDGSFEFTDLSGDALKIEALEKKGYEAEPSATRDFGYNVSENHVPDRNNPVVLRMWRSEVKERLITGKMFFAIWPDGRDYTVNLLEGKHVESVTEEGDFRIRVKRSTDAKFGQKYDWSFVIAPINGGIIEEQDPHSSMFLAPDTGFLAQYEFSIKADGDQWGHRVKKRFYVRSRGGMVVGRITVDVFPFYDLKKKDGTVGIDYAINPSGTSVLR